MWIGEALTGWTGDGQAVKFGPVLREMLTIPGEGWQDVTALPSANIKPDPGITCILFRCEAETLDAIENDSRFLVMWSEFIEEEVA